VSVERCKVRPLPAGLISLPEAVAAFLVWLPATVALTYYTLGWEGLITFTPIWALSMIYPFMKRLIPFPQLVLGAIIGGAVLPGWVAVTKDLNELDQAVPLFCATVSWVIYFDVFYATQVRWRSHPWCISRN
jgi:4-hydroxybenzoate polyprenyltransferase